MVKAIFVGIFEKNLLNSILCVFAPHPSRKVLVKLFQKLAGLGRAHKTAFLFAKSFSLRLVCQRKSGIVDYIVLSGRPQCIV